MIQPLLRRSIPAVLLAGLAAAGPPTLAGHSPPDPPLAPALSAAAVQDFLFGAPDGSVSFRVGRLFARSDGGIFDHTFRNLTVEPNDLDAIAVGADIALRAAERLHLVLGVGYSRASFGSEFRDWVDQDDQPIRQTTRFHQIPVTLGARLYLTPSGRSISRFAWIPSRAALFVSAGAGVAHYSFEQSGDFVDEATLEIFTDDFESSGFATLLYAGAGAELRLTTRAALVADVRYTHGSGRAEGDFDGLGDVGLGGLATSVGVALTF